MLWNSTLLCDRVSMEWNNFISLALTSLYEADRIGLSNLNVSNSSAASPYSLDRNNCSLRPSSKSPRSKADSKWAIQLSNRPNVSLSQNIATEIHACID
jgi:hypothetical protein